MGRPLKTHQRASIGLLEGIKLLITFSREFNANENRWEYVLNWRDCQTGRHLQTGTYTTSTFPDSPENLVKFINKAFEKIENESISLRKQGIQQ